MGCDSNEVRYYSRILFLQSIACNCCGKKKYGLDWPVADDGGRDRYGDRAGAGAENCG